MRLSKKIGYLAIDSSFLDGGNSSIYEPVSYDPGFIDSYITPVIQEKLNIDIIPADTGTSPVIQTVTQVPDIIEPVSTDTGGTIQTSIPVTQDAGIETVAADNTGLWLLGGFFFLLLLSGRQKAK